MSGGLQRHADRHEIRIGGEDERFGLTVLRGVTACRGIMPDSGRMRGKCLYALFDVLHVRGQG